MQIENSLATDDLLPLFTGVLPAYLFYFDLKHLLDASNEAYLTHIQQITTHRF